MTFEVVDASSTDEAVANLRAVLYVAGDQLGQQLARIQSVDGKALGGAAIVLALVAAVVAGNQSLWGRRWWAALIGLGFCFISFGGVGEEADVSEGPHAQDFFNTFGGQPELQAGAQLLADLQKAIDDNRAIVEKKKADLTGAVNLLGLVLIYSTCLFIWNR